jgi:hypothetical protein
LVKLGYNAAYHAGTRRRARSCPPARAARRTAASTSGLARAFPRPPLPKARSTLSPLEVLPLAPRVGPRAMPDRPDELPVGPSVPAVSLPVRHTATHVLGSFDAKKRAPPIKGQPPLASQAEPPPVPCAHRRGSLTIVARAFPSHSLVSRARHPLLAIARTPRMVPASSRRCPFAGVELQVDAAQPRHRDPPPATSPPRPTSQIKLGEPPGRPPPAPGRSRPPVRWNLAGPPPAGARGLHCKPSILCRV